MRALPGVRAASLSSVTPLGVDETLLEGDVVRHAAASRAQRLRWAQMYPEYFATLGVPVLAGRELAPSDNDRAMPRVAVINETMAKPPVRIAGGGDRPRVLPDDDASGQGDADGRQDAGFTIVGVIGDVHDSRLREPIGAVAYSSYAHTPTGRGQMTLVVRMNGDNAGQAAGVMPVLREAVRRTDPSMPLRDIETVASRLQTATRQERLVATLSSAFGALACCSRAWVCTA